MSIRNKLSDKKTKLAKTKTRIKNHPANVTDYADGSFLSVDIEIITPNPEQPRRYFKPEALEELSQSIKQRGVLQPVIIRKGNDGKVVLIAGERRFRAAKMAGLEKIPAILSTGNPLEIAIIENLQRENLSPIEEAEALDKLMKEFDYTQEQLAKAIGKARSTITEILSINKIPDNIREECRTSDIPKSHLIEVAKQKTPKQMNSLLREIKDDGLKTSHIRQKTRPKTAPALPQKAPADIALECINKLVEAILKIDFDSMKKTEKKRISKALEELTEVMGEKGI
jgi:ParB family chromosome partitioning protein